jgi:hypothetical protein
MGELIRGLAAMVMLTASAGITVYLLILASRLVRAVERIASAAEHSTAYTYASISKQTRGTDADATALST